MFVSSIPVKVDQRDLEKCVEEYVQRATQRVCRETLDSLFNDGRFTVKNVKGPAYAIIQDHIENLVLSDEAQAKMKLIVEKHWERVLEEATLNVLKHKANKLAFNAKLEV